MAGEENRSMLAQLLLNMFNNGQSMADPRALAAQRANKAATSGLTTRPQAPAAQPQGGGGRAGGGGAGRAPTPTPRPQNFASTPATGVPMPTPRPDLAPANPPLMSPESAAASGPIAMSPFTAAASPFDGLGGPVGSTGPYTMAQNNPWSAAVGNTPNPFGVPPMTDPGNPFGNIPLAALQQLGAIPANAGQATPAAPRAARLPAAKKGDRLRRPSNEPDPARFGGPDPRRFTS